MTVRLRPHHLLCILTYKGRGYSPDFVAGYDRIAGRIAEGEEIRIVDGPDDICAPLLKDPDVHCRLDRVEQRDRIAATDIGRLLKKPIRTGARLTLTSDVLLRLRRRFSAVEERAACVGCQWLDLCSEVARDGYRGTRLSSQEKRVVFGPTAYSGTCIGA